MAVFTTLALTAGFTGLAIGGSVALGVAAAGTAIYAGGYGIAKSVQAAKSGKQAVAIQQQAAATQIKQQKAQATQARRSAVRSSIIARGSATQRAAVTGGIGGSGFLGGQSSLMSQLGANLGFGGMMSGLSSDYTQLSSDAAAASGRSQLQSAQAGLGFQIANFAVSNAGAFGPLKQAPTGGSGRSGGSGR